MQKAVEAKVQNVDRQEFWELRPLSLVSLEGDGRGPARKTYKGVSGVGRKSNEGVGISGNMK
jgi:hypothetical protein